MIPRFSKVTVVISAGSDKVDLSELGLSGMTLETAVRLLEGKNLKADVREEASEEVASGTIIRYEPEEKVALGSTVTLYVSTGPEEEFVPVPNLYGKTDAEAAALLSARTKKPNASASTTARSRPVTSSVRALRQELR